jgi:UDP-N-acetyl-D-glucosamine dehydrogenase
MNPEAVRLEKKFRRRAGQIGVIGLGYVGLPLVKTFLERGFAVTGFDIDPRKVRSLNAGRSYISHISTAELGAFLRDRKFRATTDFRLLRRMDAVIICVPTPLDSHRNPDLSYVLKTTATVAANLRRGQLLPRPVDLLPALVFLLAFEPTHAAAQRALDEQVRRAVRQV